MQHVIFDLESDGLLHEITKIHCLSIHILETGEKKTFTSYEDMIKFLQRDDIILIGHYILLYDIPAIEKILKIKVTCRKIDTVALSWYLYPLEYKNGKQQTRQSHGLEHWGDILGVKKPPIDDWENLTIEEYIFRCESDVEINTRLWLMMEEYLKEIYDGLDYNRLIGYLCYKLECAREQEEEFCHIDKPKAYQHLEAVMKQIDVKTEELADSMPENILYKKVQKPKIMYKKDESLSTIGEKWIALCKEHNLDSETTKEIKVERSRKRGNPGSPIQLKKWLLDLGWEPTIIEEVKSKATGLISENAKIASNGKICSNLKDMFEEHPYLQNLEGLALLSHRKGVFEGFINACDENNNVTASIQGFTNTLRFKHVKPIANLVKVGKPWGEEIRGLIIAPNDNYTLCGSDMSALEDTTKQHYMYNYDPEYVINMRTPGFDPHTDIAVFANLMTKEEEQIFKDLKYRVEDLKEKLSPEEKEIYSYLSKVRGNAKTVNFAAVYGAGAPKIAKTLKCDIAFAQKLHKAYWERNKAVKLIARDAYYKTVGNQMWLYNPVSGFYYSLRYEKDIFSTLNQGTGVYCFDSWLRKVRSKGIKIMLQYHDEIGFKVKKGEEEVSEKALKSSIQELNNEIKLNVPLGVSVQFGDSYSSIH